VRLSWRAAFALFASLLVLVSATAVIFRIQASRSPVDTATVYSGDLAAAGIAVTLLLAVGAWWRNGRSRYLSKTSSSAQVTAAAERLAEVMADRWRLEAVRRRIITPAPAMVRWRWADGDMAAPRLDVTAFAAPGAGPAPFPSLSAPKAEVLGSGVVGRLHDELYARLPHGRLVMIGDPGAGKTGAMILLLLAALNYRASLPADQRKRVPVPVWLTMGRWDPAVISLRTWAAETMNRDHPALRAPEYGPDSAEELLHGGRVALFLDGLDEMPQAIRAQAVRRINDEAQGLRIVLTSRTVEFRHTLQDGTLHNTAVVELRPVRPAAAAAYLLNEQAGPARERWEQLGIYLRHHPDSAVARALDNPLALSAARDAYATQDPIALADTARFPTVQAISEHLLNQLVFAAYPDEGQRRHATRWLTWVARQMGTTRDLPWWEIPGWVAPWKLCLVLGATSGALFGLAVGVIATRIAGLTAGLSAGAVAGAVFGLGGGLAMPYRGILRWPRSFVPRWPRLRELPPVMGLGFGVGLEIGLIIWAATGLAVSLGAQLAPRSGPGLIFALAAGFVFGLAIGLGLGFGFLCTIPVTASPSATAVSTYRADRRTSIIAGLVIGGIAGVMVGLVFGLIAGIVAGLDAGLLAMLITVQVPIVKLTEMILSFQEHSMVNFRRLLEDALNRQLLRQAGTVYQFRHAALQDHLAAMDSRSDQDCAGSRGAN